jgi:hypothetical protein
MKTYRCTRNACYLHDCTGRDDLRERQGHYIQANSPEEARGIMSIRYPEEVGYGFTVQEWESRSVKVVEIKQNQGKEFI